jgi:glycosyltransferase involved in cell wall biosynthesis
VALARWDVWQKGLDVMAAIAEQLPGTTIEVFGQQDKNEPARTEALRASAPPGFALRPAVFGPDKLDLLRSASMYLAPSRWEGLSMGILEAMAVGLPIAVSSYVAETMPVAEHNLGLVLDDDPALAAAQLRRALGDPAALRAWSASARAWVRASCAPDAVASDLAALYSGLTEPCAVGPRLRL